MLEFLKKKKKIIPVRSGAYCRCSICTHVGYAYGIASSEVGVSHPSCAVCGFNMGLVQIQPFQECTCKSCKLKKKLRVNISICLPEIGSGLK